MADNVAFTVTGATYTAATDKVTYSGDANVDVQLVKLVGTTGLEGSKTVTEVMGTAGSPGTAVLTVQGVASGTVIPVSDGSGSLTVDNAGTFAVQAAQSGTWNVGTLTTLTGGGVASGAADSGNPVKVGGKYNSVAPTLTDGNRGDLQLDANGNLKVNIVTGAGSGGTSMVDDAAFTPATTAITPMGAMFDDVAPDSVNEGDGGVVRMSANRNLYVNIRDNAGNERGLNVDASGNITVAAIGTSVTPGTAAANLGKAVDAVAGSSDTGVMALAVRDDALSTLTPADGDYTQLRTTSTGALWVQNAGSSAIQQDDAAFTPGTSYVAVMGAQADESGTDSVDEGDGGAVRMTLDRKLITTPQPHAAGGLSIFRSLDLDETEEDVKTSAGCVYGAWVTNTATSTRFLKFYNATAANVTVGSTTPVITIGIPGNSSDDVSANFGPGGMGIFFDTAICVAATTGLADNDTGAPAANDVIVNIFYK